MRYDEIGVPPGQQASFFGAMGDSGLYVSQSPRPDSNSEEVRQYLREFFHKEPCIYSHNVFQHAALVSFGEICSLIVDFSEFLRLLTRCDRSDQCLV